MVVTEIPKVTDDMVSGDAVEKEEGKPFMLFGREFSRKQVCAAGAGILCAAHWLRWVCHHTCRVDG